ncbi:MAG: 6,7-dimethyl-8-ribityllumazine synthase [bacterium]|nr:6,7-dimethyl-8-ribityllumazine synthase [bacterium]
MDHTRKYLIVAARFNKKVTDGLLSGARRALRGAGVKDAEIKIVRVPGTWEIPFAANWFAGSDRPCAIIALGAVIKHETSHDYWINHAVFPYLQELAEEHMVPVTLGIITCDNEKQAIARSRADKENRGYVAAKAAVEMVTLLA